MFLIMIHFITCMWIYVPSIYQYDEELGESSWLEDHADNELALYVTSAYWTVTTITTVGYGDISGLNLIEKAFCALVMIIGVTLFSYSNGAAAALL